MTRIISSIKIKPVVLIFAILSIAACITFVATLALTDQSIAQKDSNDISAVASTIDKKTSSPINQPEPTKEPPQPEENIHEPVTNISATPLSWAIRIADAKIKEMPTTEEESDGDVEIVPTVTIIPSLTPVPPTVTPTQISAAVEVTISQPDGTSTFNIAWHEGMNVCDVIKQAKAAGHITSLTLDESYIASMKSPYIYEINGYKDNWVFEVNGKPTLGCALVTIEQDDHVMWKYI